MKRGWINRWTLALLLACAGLAYAALRPPLPLEEADVAVLTSPPAAAQVAAAPVSRVPLTYYQEVWERPLFSSERRPTAPVQAAVAAAPAQLSFTLEGVVLNGDTQRVLVRTRRNQLLRLRIGDQVEGWELASADALGAEFQQGGKTVGLDLKPELNDK